MNVGIVSGTKVSLNLDAIPSKAFGSCSSILLKILSGIVPNTNPSPNGLGILYCSNNELTRLPKLPDSLEDLLCENNNLPSIFYMIEGEEEVEIGVRRNYINRIRKLQKSKKNIVNTLKSHTTEKKRNNLANRNSKYPRNVMKSIANYMDEEDLENININSLKAKNVKRGETRKLKKV